MNLLQMTRPVNGHQRKKEDQTFSVIYETYEYGKFKILDANRELKTSNYNGLVNSFNEAYLLAIVIVNDKMEIIDGQHRFNAAKELGLPIRYTIAPGYGIDEVRQYNKTMQKWVKMDYKNSYVTEGKEAYVELDDFMKQFPDFGIQISQMLLTGRTGGLSSFDANGKRINNKDFIEGKLKLSKVPNAYLTARKILDFKDYFSLYNSPSFVGSIIPILTKKGYDHKRMLHKLKSSGIHLVKCATREQYRLLLQKIYNYKVSPDQKSDFFNL